MAKKKKTEEDTIVKDKDAIARERVEQLLSDVPTTLTKSKSNDSEESEDALESLEKTKSNGWLESQLSALNERNEALEAELHDAKESFKKLSADFSEYRKKAGLPQTDSELQVKIVSLFKKFERQYKGENPEKTKYTSIKFTNHPNNNGVLDEFLKSFGDILKKKK
ncbi:MAG: hypothetical protein HC836_15640 [Richelia sp. RM2_1_2]|nr:hypothetical protein [Richelia sp. RM2_1_2]